MFRFFNAGRRCYRFAEVLGSSTDEFEALEEVCERLATAEVVVLRLSLRLRLVARDSLVQLRQLVHALDHLRYKQQ